MSDSIDRQAMIDLIEDDSSNGVYSCFASYQDAQKFKQKVMDLSPTQPERKRGEWEFYEDRSPVWDIAGEKTWARAYKCSECGFVHAVIENFGIYQYCPQCGADMREDNHETD